MPISVEQHRSGRSKAAILVMGALGIGLILWGGYSLWESGGMARAGEAFLQATVRGELAAAEKWLLTPNPLPPAISSSPSLQPRWGELDDVRIELIRQKSDGETGTLDFRITRQGYFLKPRLTMQRTEQGWRVARIENLEPDPRWNKEEREEQAARNEQIADELIQKLADPETTAD